MLFYFIFIFLQATGGERPQFINPWFFFLPRIGFYVICMPFMCIDWFYIYVFQKTPWASFTEVPFESCGWVKPQANCLLYNCGLKRCTLSKSSCCFMRWWTSSFSKSNTFPCCSIKRARFIWSQSSKVSTSEWNQMLLWAKHFRWGTLDHSSNMSRVANNVGRRVEPKPKV